MTGSQTSPPSSDSLLHESLTYRPLGNVIRPDVGPTGGWLFTSPESSGRNEEWATPACRSHPPPVQRQLRWLGTTLDPQVALGCTWGPGDTQQLTAASGPGQTYLRAQYHSATSQKWPASPRRQRGQVMPGQCHSDGAGGEPSGTKAPPISPGSGTSAILPNFSSPALGLSAGLGWEEAMRWSWQG